MNGDSPPVEVVLRPPEDEVRRDLARLDESRYGRYARFVLAALSSLPWVGGLMGASAALHGEREQEKVNSLQRKWLEEHSERLHDVAAAIDEVVGRLDQFGEDVKERIESEEYDGQFLRKPPQRVRPGMASPVMKSAFDGKEPYEPTELGKQFVHYTMNEIVPKVGDGVPASAAPPGTTT